MLIDSKATPIPIVEKAYGVHVAMLADRTLLDNASFILVVRADMPGETLRGRFGQQSKIGSVEHIRDLVNLQLPGMACCRCRWRRGRFRSTQAPPITSWTVAASTGSSWTTPVGLPFISPGEFPGLNLAFWAIRG